MSVGELQFKLVDEKNATVRNAIFSCFSFSFHYSIPSGSISTLFIEIVELRASAQSLRISEHWPKSLSCREGYLIR